MPREVMPLKKKKKIKHEKNSRIMKGAYTKFANF